MTTLLTEVLIAGLPGVVLTSADLWAFTLLAVLLIITPGADTMLLVRNAILGGTPAALATVFGSRLGLVAHAFLAAVGLSAVLASSAQAFQAVRTAGAAYLIWLGVRSLLRAGRPPMHENEIEDRDRRAHSPWLEGFLTNLLNPKTALFYLAVLPQFLNPQRPARSAVLLASIHIFLSLVWYLGLVLAMDRGQRLVIHRGGRRIVEAISGAALVGLGTRLLFEHN